MDQVAARMEWVLSADSAELREKSKAIKALQEAINKSSKEQIIEKAAYTWFNRLAALRYMDVNDFQPLGLKVITPKPGFTLPEILDEAKQGHIPSDLPLKGQHVLELLNGAIPSSNPQNEAYSELLIASCNHLHKILPFLFEAIDDYTELLLPADIISEFSIIRDIIKGMRPEDCQDVEVIGWLYQFYISEKKDEVFDGLKKNKKITPENIPAATQLFTPHWIVRYLVENSLGRLWMLNRPNSRLKERMDYYIEPQIDTDGHRLKNHENNICVNPCESVVQEDFLHIGKPEEIKICDPACGSGHMLTYAFDLLYAIYEEEGYEPAEIQEKILTNNLYGIEIDERAGELAAFALTMKARAKQRRFFNKGVKPNICVLENVHFDEGELKNYMDFVGRDLFTAPLQTTLRQFEEADNFGSLIRPDVTDVDTMLRILESKNVSGQLFVSMTHQKVLQALRQADFLTPKYHVVIANPPYKLRSDLNSRLASFLDTHYPISKTDLFAAFIERGFGLIPKLGFSAMVTMESWMFLASYEKLRSKILKENTLICMTHMPYLGKGGTSMGISFGTDAKIIQKGGAKAYTGHFCCVRYYETDENMVPLKFPVKNERLSWVNNTDFLKIPGCPIAYWVDKEILHLFATSIPFADKFYAKQGIATGRNELFLRSWHEVSIDSIDFTQTDIDNFDSASKWFPYSKGGEARRWYGNNELIVDWETNGHRIKNFKDDKGKLLSRPQNLNFQFREAVTWSLTSSSIIPLCARYRPTGYVFDVNGMSAFPMNDGVPSFYSVGLLNSYIPQRSLQFINPTMAFQSGDISRVPLPKNPANGTNLGPAASCVDISRSDWDSFETSWDFTSLLVLSPDYRQPTLKADYQKLRAHWREMTLEMQRLEEENNRIFIEAYGLQDELTPEVPLNEITLTCNPHYRYDNDKSEDELEALLLADTMRELVSYAVGCMFGRYSLDKEGLILANQGETLEDYLKKVEKVKEDVSFLPDKENIIPVLTDEWFTDDIATRFYDFLKVTFGKQHYQENLAFIEDSLGKDIRKYFIRDFYTDHVKRYKKRPIYWMFSSPKGSFNVLIYLHRYTPDTLNQILNSYLKEYMEKLRTRIEYLDHIIITGSSTEQSKAAREKDKLRTILIELQDYERDILYPLATERIPIDLDDGVLVNYNKFGKAVKELTGLNDKKTKEKTKGYD